MAGRILPSIPRLLPAWFSLRHAHTAATRSTAHATLRAEDLDCFRDIVGDTAVVTDGTALKALNKYVCVPQLVSNQANSPYVLVQQLFIFLFALMCFRDWMGRYEGKSRVALRPKTTEQVSKLLAHCNERRLAVVPQVSTSKCIEACSSHRNFSTLVFYASKADFKGCACRLATQGSAEEAFLYLMRSFY